MRTSEAQEVSASCCWQSERVLGVQTARATRLQNDEDPAIVRGTSATEGEGVRTPDETLGVREPNEQQNQEEERSAACSARY